MLLYIEELKNIYRKEVYINKVEYHIKLIEILNNQEFLKESKKFENLKEAMKWLEEEHGLLIQSHASSLRSVAITHDNKCVVSGSHDNTIRVWNLQEKRQEAVLLGHTSSVSSVAITQDNKYVVSGSNDKTVRIWNLKKNA